MDLAIVTARTGLWSYISTLMTFAIILEPELTIFGQLYYEFGWVNGIRSHHIYHKAKYSRRH